ncbi:hypothetical protein YPPY89_3243, partial [Yersinia pestis PY-89]
MVEAIAGVF